MQRRSIQTTASAAPESGAPSNEISLKSSTAVRRLVRRRRRSKLSGMEDIKSLLVITLVTCALTASVVVLGSRLYSTAVKRSLKLRDEQQPSRLKHRHSRIHSTETGNEEQADDDWDVLPWNPIYAVPEAMTTLGDRSDEYARLRQKIDQILPPDPARSLARVAELNRNYGEIVGTQVMGAHHSDQVREAYDIYNCPDKPPAGYPFEWKLVDEVLDNWPVKQIENVPAKIHNGLCIFDYAKDYEKAVRYRKVELPFVVVNDPQVARAAERWSIPGYLSR